MLRFLRLALSLGCPLMVTALSVDLLYLYSVGAWHDPVMAIEVSEVVALFALVTLGIWGFIQEVRRAGQGNHASNEH